MDAKMRISTVVAISACVADLSRFIAKGIAINNHTFNYTKVDSVKQWNGSFVKI